MTRARPLSPGTRFPGATGPAGLSVDGVRVEPGRGRAYLGPVGTDPTQTTIERLLGELRAGDGPALEELFSLLYDELHGLARRQRQRWVGEYTLNTTALVHEAYLKLAGREGIGVESRAHFSAVAARAMRQILCNYARDRRAQKRGGASGMLTLDEAHVSAGRDQVPAEPSDLLLALDEALRRLEQVDPRRARVVECRFFGGLTIEETATAIGASTRTVKRDWAVAQAWLHREMDSGP
jgi:RNA polymerase sigma factor (TIGR02999 family)